MANKTYERLVEHIQKIADLQHATAVLHWDKEVNLPPRSVEGRSRQIATLDGMAHQLFVSSKTRNLLKELADNFAQLEEAEKRNVSLLHRDFERSDKLDEAFVMRKSRLISEGYHAWLQARKENDFTLFAPALEALVGIKKEEAERVGYQEHPYDALLDEFEPGYRSSKLDILFADVRKQLVDFAAAIRDKEQVDDRFLHQHYPDQKQWDFGLDILQRIGYDFDYGRQDRSPHPFTITFNSRDVRVTTIVDEDNLANMIWSCIHEGGHALYEQGLPFEQYGLPLGSAVSLGIHESQSRLWENNVGRSRIFWESHLDLLKEYFPQQLEAVDLDPFFKGINKVFPSPIRIESDELHYHFHIMVRYEIEKALIEGSLSVEDIPSVWNEKYKDYLGLDIESDNQGCLQDIHWAHGSIGYFPTYSLGSFYAAQFFAQAEKDLPQLNQQMASGDTRALLKWLRENIHQYGRKYEADDLCERITGEPLNFQYFMDYAKKKYGDIYGL
ncbi:MAG TPA: carboxypeptidase M32 [Saprospiraceae bacterium]|nr:carboxypeptidase M32 [Saprospiraceae bacterium]